MRYRKPAIALAVLLLLAAGLVIFWLPIQDAFHRYQVRAVLDESLAGGVHLVHARSRDLHRNNAIYIYTPPGYGRSKRRYPVVYLLHGCPGAGRDWFVKGRAHETVEELILAKRIQPMILVSANAFGPKGPRDRMEFLNSANGRMRVEDYISNELPRFIDSTMRTIRSPDARALIGLSSGGYGAINVGTRHPDVFHVLASHSGFFDPKYEAPYVRHILGPKGPLWDENNPHKQVAKWRSEPNLRIYLDCGDDDELLSDNKQLDRELTANSIKHVFHITQGTHRWSVWRLHLRDSLLYADARFKELAAKRQPR